MGVAPAAQGQRFDASTMRAFSPLDAALEGFRVIRREPKAVVAWLSLWVLSLCIVAVSTTFGGRSAPVNPYAHLGVIGLVLHLGPLAILLLVSLICTTTATFRSVLRPADRGRYFLRFGPSEARVSVALFVGWLLAPLVILVVNYLLFVLASPFMQALPGFLREITQAGALLTSLVLFWLFVRLSLIPVETFDEGRFHLSLYWPITKRHFWRLLASYVIWGVVSAVISAVCSGLAFYLGLVVFSLGRPHTFQIVLVLLVVPIVLLTATAFMLPWILLCACQAYAYRGIADSRATHATVA
jgi:hypothetical protein